MEIGPIDAAIAPLALSLLAESVAVANELLFAIDRAGDAARLRARVPLERHAVVAIDHAEATVFEFAGICQQGKETPS